jgi:hypothetical protein
VLRDRFWPLSIAGPSRPRARHRPEQQRDLVQWLQDEDQTRIDRQREFEFSWELMVKENRGNPLKTAIVFLNVTNGEIDRNPTWPYGVYCMVPLPPSF